MEIMFEKDWAPPANKWLADKVKQYDAKRMGICWGGSPKPIFKSWRESPPLVLKDLEIYAGDDIEDGEHKGMGIEQIRSQLPGVTILPPTEGVQLDLVMIGIGINGHVLFNEPGTPPDLPFGLVTLEEDTADRLDVDYGTQAITYGIGTLMQCKAILLLVGPDKLDIFEEAVSGNRSLPVWHLLDHHDLTVLIEE